MSEYIRTPVGRLVEGNLYKGNDVDIDGQPKKFKTGKNAGQPRSDFYFALAIPKGNETNWNQTDWGKAIESVAKLAFPGGQWQRRDFSWKITDGDSTEMNKNNRRPCDKEGFKGHWVLKFSRPFKSKIFNRDGSKELTEENFVNLGDYAEVYALVAGNNSDKQPGVYLNHMMVAFSGYGERIVLGPDPKSVGFGQGPLPQGASAVPPAAFNPPVESDQAPYTPILTPPPAPPAAPIGRIMLPAAAGHSYESYKDSGWTDAQLIENGLMAP